VLARKPSPPVAASVLAFAFALLTGLLACAPRPGRAAPAAAAANGAGAVPEVEVLDKFGAYRARRLVLSPVAAARLAPGDAAGEVSQVVTLGRARDAGSILLLRFSVDLLPETAIFDAHVVLDRAPSVQADPSPIALHATRIVDPWDAGSIAWGRAPRLAEAHLAATTVTGARASVRIDVAALVQRWRRHAPDDQGIAIVADGSSVTGMTFALADGGGASDDEPVPLSVHAPGPPSLFSGSEPADGRVDTYPRGPRLELYVRP
jgi:hypothetical protein